MIKQYNPKAPTSSTEHIVLWLLVFHQSDVTLTTDSNIEESKIRNFPVYSSSYDSEWISFLVIYVIGLAANTVYYVSKNTLINKDLI